MPKLILIFIFAYSSLFASTDSSLNIDLTMTWVGILCLVIFLIGYYFVATEEKYHLDKAKPALFIGTFMFILVAIYYVINNLDVNLVPVTPAVTRPFLILKFSMLVLETVLSDLKNIKSLSFLVI